MRAIIHKRVTSSRKCTSFDYQLCAPTKYNDKMQENDDWKRGTKCHWKFVSCKDCLRLRNAKPKPIAARHMDELLEGSCMHGSSTCPKCGGFVGETGKSYGYAGKWCHCTWPQETTPIVGQQQWGWLCPACGKGNAPHSKQCDCAGLIKITSNNTAEIKV